MNSPAFFTVFCAIIVKDKFKGGSSMKKILLIVMNWMLSFLSIKN